MIQKFQIIHHVGRFESYSAPSDTALNRATFVYAENARGKTTLTAILRSLSTDDPIPILERKQIGASGDPHIVIEYDNPSSPAVFQNSNWSTQVPDILIFDDVFVHENVHSGLVVDSAHRQGFHDIIIGRAGVSLAREVERLTGEISTAHKHMTGIGNTITPDMRGSLSVDEFCALKEIENIDQEIKGAEKNVSSIEDSEEISMADEFGTLSLPKIEVNVLEEILQSSLSDLDIATVDAVNRHFESLGVSAERWVAEGMDYISEEEHPEVSDCPFCGQDLASSSLVTHYRSYFKEEYKLHKSRITDVHSSVTKDFSGDSLAEFQRQARDVIELIEFWGKYLDIPEISIELKKIAAAWIKTRDTAIGLLERKQLAPLEQITLDDEDQAVFSQYDEIIESVDSINRRLAELNPNIRGKKKSVSAGNIDTAMARLQHFQTSKMRHEGEVTKVCEQYLEAKTTKAELESQKTQARQELDTHRSQVIAPYEESINIYLAKFNADFRIRKVTATNPTGKPSSTYNIEINDQRISITGTATSRGAYGFRNTLSSGDRNTLALAFFFSWLKQEPDISSVIVVIDDPITSLDTSRSIVTAQEIRDLIGRTKQVILLSHHKQLLCTVWERLDKSSCAELEIVRSDSGSELRKWDIHQAAITEHDKLHKKLCEYERSNIGDKSEVAKALRPFLDGYLRVAYPEYFPPGQMFGRFIGHARDKLGTSREFMSEADIDDLEQLNEYARRFHHDSNPAYTNDIFSNITDGELGGFARRILVFANG